jgi:hypothetical protein
LAAPATSSRTGKGKSKLTATTNHQLAVKRPVQPLELQIRIAFFGPSAGISARAQQAAMPVIGYLSGASREPLTYLISAFRQGLGEIGYVEGQNLAIEYRWAEGTYDRLPALATTAAHSCRGYPRWEPHAGKLHVRICAGGCEVTRIPTATRAPGLESRGLWLWIGRCKGGGDMNWRPGCRHDECMAQAYPSRPITIIGLRPFGSKRDVIMDHIIHAAPMRCGGPGPLWGDELSSS